MDGWFGKERNSIIMCKMVRKTEKEKSVEYEQERRIEERLERWDLVWKIWDLEIIFMIFFIPIFLKVIIKLLEVSELLKLQNNIREHEKISL